MGCTAYWDQGSISQFSQLFSIKSVFNGRLFLLSPLSDRYKILHMARRRHWAPNFNEGVFLDGWFNTSLTHLPLMPHIYASDLSSISSGNGLSHVWCQAITWSHAELLSIGALGTNLSEIPIKIQKFSLVKMHLNMSSVKWRTFCLGGYELISAMLHPIQPTSHCLNLGGPDEQNTC